MLKAIFLSPAEKLAEIVECEGLHVEVSPWTEFEAIASVIVGEDLQIMLLIGAAAQCGRDTLFSVEYIRRDKT